ncbi:MULTISPECIES: 8-amino-7-oxononanoate synthase [unclassified Sphingomonas]|jgi:8-amino-7-oxononanoate synthase|uniref:8-amino-7-oxononanoate synthase n=1 Tax=unclassified Sphingomonas TaxID=196159 RepID=UPI000E10AF45|nr:MULTISPECIES: 8-amino-7-oxononanoate synthase [unclassified Sphingomonas]AXJ96981.1 8-amino-7-oxononanoate synthase [Sphingomonas sp. FARSPH]
MPRFHHDDLARLAAADRLRSLRPRAGADFASNDYLGLAGSPRLGTAVAAALARGVAVGSGGSRLLRGNHPEHEALEVEAARHFGSAAALFFASGFAANQALFATLPQPDDIVVHDERIHASAHDGMRLGRAPRLAVRHNDADAFDTAIRDWRARGGTGTPWIAVESLYSMDGDVAPLDDLARIASRHDAMLLIDEAHASGVFGPRGRGLAHHLHHRDDVVTLHTCGKALGVEGGLLCLPAHLREFLINRGRGFVFSTAPSPLVAAAVREALRMLADEPERQTALAALVTHAGKRLVALGVPPTGTQIVPVILGEDGVAVARATALQAAGFDVRAIRPPTVAPGTARLRLSITLNVDAAAIDALADTLAAILEPA